MGIHYECTIFAWSVTTYQHLVHSLYDHHLQFDMSVDTFGQHLEEASLSLEGISLSLDHVLHSSLLDVGFSSSTVWPRMPVWSILAFGIDMETLEHASETSSSIIHRHEILHTSLVLFLPKGRNVVRRDWIIFSIQCRASTIIVGDSTLRGSYLVSLLLLSYGGVFFLTWGFYLLILHWEYCITFCISSLFWGGVFPMRFSPFPHLWEIALHLYMGT